MDHSTAQPSHIPPGRHSLWRTVFFGGLSARGGTITLFVLITASLITLPFSIRWYNVQSLEQAVRHGPEFTPVVPLAQYTGGSMGSPSQPVRDSNGSFDRFAHRAASWFGHDDLGRSLFYRVLPGFLISLGLGLCAAFIAACLGTTFGAVAALAGGRVDLIMMRIVDVLYGLPYILMVILLKVALTRPIAALCGGHTRIADVIILLIAISGVSWLTMARVIRGQVLSLRGQPFVEAARAAGAGNLYIIRRHLLPNLVGPIATYAALVIPQAVLQESFLSFLGIGIQQPTPSLGRLAADGVLAVNTFVGFWWLLLFPCAFLVITLIALNFIADGLRDAIDPKSSVTHLV